MQKLKIAVAGFCAGAVNGLFGAGGGMILVPLLTLLTDIEDQDIFPASISVIFPICITSLSISAIGNRLPFSQALPYLIGSIGGGLLAGITAKQIPVKWLHRVLGALIFWGGIRYLC